MILITRNLNEAHEKHQELTKKNIGKLEEQIRKSNESVNEVKLKNITEISTKNEEIILLKFKLDEQSTSIEVLQKQLEQKEKLVRDLGIEGIIEYTDS